MKWTSVVMNMSLAGLLLASIPCFSAGQGAAHAAERTGEQEEQASEEGALLTLRIPFSSPLFSDVPIAAVNDDQITLEDLTGLLASSHESKMGKKSAGTAKIDFSEPLKRLINIKLIVQEARNIGLDELPEIAKAADTFSQSTLIQLLKQQIVKDVTIDDKDVEPVYKEMVKEWKLTSLLFDKEEDAKKTKDALKTGGNFDETVKKALQDGTAKGSAEGKFLNVSGLSPEVVEVVSKMDVGSVSPIIKMGAGKHLGYSLIRLEEVRYPDSPTERERARQQVLAAKKGEVAKKYRDVLYKKYLTLNTKRIKSLDYESNSPGLQKLAEDKRVIVTIAGEDPIMVKDLTQAVKDKFYHGVDVAIGGKKINKVKQSVLEGVIDKRVYRKEALLQGLDKTKQYQKLVKEYEESLLFGMFVKKVVGPDVKLNDDEMKKYYQDHLVEYTYPEMMKIDGLAFDALKDAESALNKLKKGADYKWMRDNAEGRTDTHAENLLTFGENVLMVKSLPEDIQKALSGAKAGEFRLATGADGRHYVLSVLDVIPARTQPLEEAAQAVAQNVLTIKLQRAVEEWCDKLRKEADVRIYLSSGRDK